MSSLYARLGKKYFELRRRNGFKGGDIKSGV